MSALDREQRDREEAADAICAVIRQYVIKNGCTVTVEIERIPAEAWDTATGRLLSDHWKREQVGPHIITYWKEGA